MYTLYNIYVFIYEFIMLFLLNKLIEMNENEDVVKNVFS